MKLTVIDCLQMVTTFILTYPLVNLPSLPPYCPALGCALLAGSVVWKNVRMWRRIKAYA